MNTTWKLWLTRALVSSLAIPTSLLLGLANATTAQASVGSVVLNEILSWPTSGDEMVELYNASGSTVDISGWTIVEAGATTVHTVPAATTVAAGGFYTADLGVTSVLANSGDTVTLKNGATTVDSLTYGDNLAATIVAPASGKTLGRVTDGGTWYSGLTASIGSTNDSPSVPSAPSAAVVKAGASNAASVINSASKGAVSVDVTVGAGSLVSDTVTARLYDSVPTFKSGTVAGTAGAGTATVTGIDTTAATALIDGAITLRSFATNSAGRSTGYVSGTAATRDTSAPTPTVTTPAAPITIHASSTTVAGSTEAGSTVKIYASDGTTLVATATVTGTNYSASVPLTANSANSFLVKATDTAGNTTLSPFVSVPTITEDSTAPATVTVTSYATSSNGKVTINWTASASADVLEYRIFTDNATGSVNYATALSSVASPATSFTSDVLANGTYQFVIRVADLNGNVTSNTDAISIVVSGPKLQSSATAPGTTADLVSSTGLSFTPAAGTSGSSTFTVTNNGTALPAGSVPTGISFLGQYFSVTDTVTPSSTNPVLVKFYYTQAQLTAAGISETQLQGIYYYDSASGSWKLYSNTGVNTTDVVLGGTSFAGYVYANADHFTPLAFGADTVAPNKPGNLTATPGDAQVKLTWDSVSDATSYVVRWRPATSKDTVAYTMMTVSGGSTTSATATGLNNGWEYELGVAAVDAVGNVGQFAVVIATPRASVSSSSTGSVTLASTVSSTSLNAAGSNSSESSKSTSSTPTNAENGQVGGGSSTSSNAAQNRALVIALILVIAAGAGAAGYYGYQWWAERPVPATPNGGQPTPPEPKAPAAGVSGKRKGKSNGGRW